MPSRRIAPASSTWLTTIQPRRRGADDHVQPPAEGLVDDAAGSWLARRVDVAEDGERRLRERLPNLLAGQPRLNRPAVVLGECVGYPLARRVDVRFIVTRPGCHGSASLLAAGQLRPASGSGGHFNAVTQAHRIQRRQARPEWDLWQLEGRVRQGGV